MEKVDYKFRQLQSAYERLEEVASIKFPASEIGADSIVIDSAIQRFEFTTELFWKFLKTLLEYKGIAVNATPVDVIRAAKTAGILTADDQWIALIRDRNITSHVYDDAQATVIYNKVKDTYVSMFKQFIEDYAGSSC